MMARLPQAIQDQWAEALRAQDQAHQAEMELQAVEKHSQQAVAAAIHARRRWEELDAEAKRLLKSAQAANSRLTYQDLEEA